MHSLFGRQPLVSLVCTLIFAISIPVTAYAVDGCSAAGFKVATNINVEASPFGIAVADFNSDGHLDVVMSPNNSSNELIMLFGRGGSEKFDPPVTFPAGGQAGRLTAADFNGDGKSDLAVSLSGGNTPPGRLSILLNNGTGQFGAPNIVTLPGDPILPIVGDVNNDGKLDIVTGLSNGTTDGLVIVLLGNGSGNFSAATAPFATFSRNSAEVRIGDFNEDSKPDLAVPGTLNGVDIYLGDGTGAVAPAIHVTTSVASFTLTSGDFNNDGHLDLLDDNQMLLGTGMVTFAAPIVITLPENTSAALAGDVNNDGHLDLLTAATSGLTVFLGNGTGNLTRASSYSSGFTVFGASSLFAALGDFNEDGKTDIAAVQSKGIGILAGDGTGAFHDALAYQTSTNPRYLIAADFNNDGKQDFATIGPGFQSFPAATVEVALGDGIGGFTRKSVTSFGGNLLAAIDAADFNGDGKLDLAVTQPSNGLVSILLNDGTGGFPTNGFTAPFVSVNFQPWAIKAGDFNGDNKTDLFVIRRAANDYIVLIGNGNADFPTNSGGPLQGTSSFFDELAISDFNADNKLDVAVIRSGANLVNVLQGNGTGQFFNYATAAVPGIPVSLVVGDLNGDSKPDIAVTSSVLSDRYVSVLINNGTGFNAATNYPTEAGGIPAIGDFNGDSKPDLAISSGASQVGSNVDGVVVLTNTGDGTFSAPVHFSVSTPSDYVAVKDFNSDGKDDVVISQPGGRSVSLLLNNFTMTQPCLSVNDITIDEPDAGTVNAVFTVKLSAPSAQTLRVNYFTVPTFGFGGAATQGADFERVSGSVTFLPGETTQTVNVPIKGDLIDEPDQSVDLVLTTPINALISDGRGRVTIIDNDAPPVLSVNDVAVNEGTQTQSSATFTVSLNLPSEKDVSVQFEFAPGTATPNTDYPNFSGTVAFTAGVVTRTITVPLVQDNIFEPDETFFVNLSNATNATVGDSQGQATILNDDPLPSITINAAATPAEGAAGTSGNLPFQVKLSNPSFQTITVSYATADGTATAGSDYTATSGTVSFNPGETVKTINVEVLGDNVDEMNETLFINLTNPANANIATAQAMATILDDDGPTVSINSVSVVEGQSGLTNAVFTVSLSGPSVQDILVSYSTAGGSATSNVDFQRVTFNNVFIPAGGTSTTLTIRVFGDLQIEQDEQFFVILQTASNATIANGQGTGTIVNDDSSGKLQFSSQAYSATENAGNVVISVSRVDGATGIVTVDYATGNGTATAGSDYVATSGTLTFNQGEITKTFTVPIISDNVFEADETVNLTLSTPRGGATLGNPTASVLTITTPPLFIALDESDSQKAAALDSLWFTKDPFSIIVETLLNPVSDHNTRVIIFVSNLQLAPGDLPSTVKVNLFDSIGQSHDVDAEDVRLLPVGNFMQVRFRLPDNLHAGDCVIKVKAHNQESNSASIRIKE